MEENKMKLTINDTIKSIVRRDFPGTSVGNIRIYERNNGEKSLSLTINGELFYLSGLPNYSRETIYKLINE